MNAVGVILRVKFLAATKVRWRLGRLNDSILFKVEKNNGGDRKYGKATDFDVAASREFDPAATGC